MRRSLALVCLLAALAAVGLAAPQDRPNPAGQKERFETEKGVPPTILSPQPGDTIFSSVVTVTGTSNCWPVVLTWTPVGSTTQPVELNPIPGTNTWTYDITDVPGPSSVKACCKGTPLCSEVSSLVYATATAVKPQTAAAPAAPAARGMPTYRLGRVQLSHLFPYEPGKVESVYVVVENLVVTDERLHRSQAVKADLHPLENPERKPVEAEWRACFTFVRPDFYLVRVVIMPRGGAVQSQSYVIRVVP